MRASSNASNPHSYGDSFSASGRFGPRSFPSTTGATPTARPTSRNSRIGKYSASIGVRSFPSVALANRLVPTSRLELLRLIRPLAPQASVSTNFTTWAQSSARVSDALTANYRSIRHVFRFRGLAGSRLRGLCRGLGCFGGGLRRFGGGFLRRARRRFSSRLLGFHRVQDAARRFRPIG